MKRKRWYVYLVVVILILLTATLATVLGQRDPLQVRLPSKKPVQSKPIKISENIVTSLAPAGYEVKKWIQADLDNDKTPELVLACQPQDIDYEGASNLPAKILVFASKNGRWQKIWDFQDRSSCQSFTIGRMDDKDDREPVLIVEDINQDGLAELVFSLVYFFGASGSTISTFVYQRRNGNFVSLLDEQLGHSREGGVIVDERDICFYEADWADYESGGDSHRYKAKVYHWNGKKYAESQGFQTVAKGDEGEKELKENFQRVIQGKPLIVKKLAEPELNPGLNKDSIDEAIKADLKKVWRKAKSPQYILDSYDQKCFKSGREDIRVLRTLEELTKNKGHILAVRVKSGYHTSNLSVSRESDPGWDNESPHYTAQAFDIFYADGVEIGWQEAVDPALRQKARDKIRQLMKEILEFGRRNDLYLPTQLCVYDRADILFFSQEARTLYGGYPPETGLRGMMVGDRYWDRVHVGY